MSVTFWNLHQIWTNISADSEGKDFIFCFLFPAEPWNHSHCCYTSSYMGQSCMSACRCQRTAHTGGLKNWNHAAYIWSTWHAWKIITLRLTSKVDGLQQLPSCYWLYFPSLVWTWLNVKRKKKEHHTESFSWCHMIRLIRYHDFTPGHAPFGVTVTFVVKDKIRVGNMYSVGEN